ncbi:metal-independent alpha-mannosidase [archaeon]|nr:MAG: metal-independent alpha-mannosidase [archaeon]
MSAMLPAVFERKWEVDSLANVLYFSAKYWAATHDTSPFNSTWLAAVETILSTFVTQQQDTATEVRACVWRGLASLAWLSLSGLACAARTLRARTRCPERASARCNVGCAAHCLAFVIVAATPCRMRTAGRIISSNELRQSRLIRWSTGAVTPSSTQGSSRAAFARLMMPQCTRTTFQRTRLRALLCGK